MNHLRILKYLNYTSFALLVLAGGITLVSIGVTAAAVVAAAPEAALVLIPSVAITLLTLLFIGVIAWFALLAGRGIEHGRGRISQTIVAVGSLASAPLGTAFGIYALWVCWVNEETKATFDATDVRRELAWAGLGIAILLTPLVPLLVLTLTAIVPTDLAALDAEAEPIEDRSQRVARAADHCGLNESGPPCTRITTTVRTEEVSFPTRNDAMGLEALNGTLYLPENLDGPRPAAILVHGSGPQDRHERTPGELITLYDEPIAIFDTLATTLAQQGLVVLTYDKRACGSCYPHIHEAGDYSEFRFQLFLEDALAGVDYLASRDDVLRDAVVVLGHSQGGGFAPHIAAADERVVAAVMLAGFTGTFRDAIVDQLHLFGDIRRRQWDWFGAWSVDLQARVYKDCLDKLDGDYDPDDMCVGGGTSLRAMAEYDVLNRTTPDVIGNLDVPLFAVAGTIDRNIPPPEMARIVAASKGGDAEFHLIAGMGHGLTNVLEPADPPELEPEFLDRLEAFLTSVATPMPPQPPSEEPPADDLLEPELGEPPPSE